MNDSFKAMLARWGFRPINAEGRPNSPAEPAPQKQFSEEVKEITKKILSTPNVKL